MRLLPRLDGPRCTLVVLLASVALLVGSLRRALHIAPLQRATIDMAPLHLPSGVAPSILPLKEKLATVDIDPFHPERRRAAERFRIPEPNSPEGTRELEFQGSAAPASSLHLIGTMFLPGGKAVAVCQWGDEPARMVRVGETIRDLTLKEVDRGRALFVSAAGTPLEVHVPKEAQ
jgi:hypothetical protein